MMCSTEKIRCTFWRAHACSFCTPTPTFCRFPYTCTRLFATGTLLTCIFVCESINASRATLTSIHSVGEPHKCRTQLHNTTVACFACTMHRYETDASEELDSFVMGTPHLDDDDGVGNRTCHFATGRFALSICCTSINEALPCPLALTFAANKTIDRARTCGCMLMRARGRASHHAHLTSQ